MKHQTSSDEYAAAGPGTDAATANGVSGDGAESGVANEFRNFVSDVEHLLGSATSLTGEDLDRLKSRLKARIASARASVLDAGSAVADRARTGAKATDHFVHARPWQAVGIGAAVGVLIGLLLGRRGK
jgi:ElaB/YqjD/DUF883 family membrane-anchored ribosome-binding protein